MLTSIVSMYVWRSMHESVSVPQVASLSRQHEKDSYRLSWGAEHLDNVLLTNTLLHSGYDTHTHTHTHTHTICNATVKRS